jgi:hypothetical protein
MLLFLGQLFLDFIQLFRHSIFHEANIEYRAMADSIIGIAVTFYQAVVTA